jgi:transposase
MLLQAPNVTVWLYLSATDMRKQFDGLAALVQTQLTMRANTGDLFVFINRRRTQMKVLYYSKGGWCLWSKRLEKGCFHQVQSGDNTSKKMPLSWTELHCLIDGINWQKTLKNKRF